MHAVSSDDTTSWYTTFLVRKIHLRGDQWTVGLVDLQIPNTIELVADEELYRIDGIKHETYYLRTEDYESMQDFIGMINAAPGINNHHKFRPSSERQGYYAFNRVCECASPYMLTFHDKINQLLGFEGN